MRHLDALLSLCLGLGSLSCAGCSSTAGDEAGGPAVAPDPSNAPRPTGPVRVNGRELGEDQLAALRQVYGQQPVPGDYWYDPASGLFGVTGGPAAGFLLPGHDLGPCPPSASGGRQGVFVNGRALHDSEIATLTWLANGVILPGRYWLDAMGNVGYEGMPVAIGNLYLLAQSRGGGGGGGRGGDNIWSTRFCGGNYNDDNSAGYVQLPNGQFSSYGL